MTGILDEALAGETLHGNAAVLQAGLDVLSENQTVTFTKYVKLVLPLDGFVFWVKADLLTRSALANAFFGNQVQFNQAQKLAQAATAIAVPGSMHQTTLINRGQDDSSGRNSMVFTSEKEIEFLNEVGPSVRYMGEFRGQRFMFARRSSFYEQSGLFHYVGDAVYSYMESQIIDNLQALNARELVVSNSLPIWLGLPAGVPSLPMLFPGLPVPFFPSYLIPEDQAPPYVSVHIAPESTEAIQAGPYYDSMSGHYQLVQERVRLTTYGLNNRQAMAVLDYALQYCLLTDNMGISNSPVIRDEKQPQPELNAIAMKKSMEFVVNYYQTQARDIARQRILSAFVNQTVDGVPIELPETWDGGGNWDEVGMIWQEP